MSAARPARKRHVSPFLFFWARFRSSLASRICFMMLASFLVARISVRPSEECRLLGDTRAALALPLVVPVALQVSVLRPSVPVEPRLPSKRNCRCRARHNSRPALTGASRVRETRLPTLTSRASEWERQNRCQSSGPPDHRFRNRAHHESARRPATGQSSALVSVSSSTTSRHTRILRGALSAPKGRTAKGRIRESLRSTERHVFKKVNK